MKIPIEFINHSDTSDKLYYSLMSELAVFEPQDCSLDVEFTKNHAKTNNIAILNLLTRSKNMSKLLLELEAALKQKEYEIKRLQKHDYQIFDLVPLDDILASTKNVEGLHLQLNSKINSIFVTVTIYSKFIKYLEKSATNYSYDLTDEVARLEALEATIRAFDAAKYETKIAVLEEVVEDLENMLDSNLQTDVYAIAEYHVALLVRVSNLVHDTNEFLSTLESRYQFLLGVYKLLNKDLTALLVRAEMLYKRMIDGDYIRSGNNVSVEKVEGINGAFLVSATKPKLTACAPLNPWYEAADIVVEKAASNCAEQPINSPLHPDFNPNPSGSNVTNPSGTSTKVPAPDNTPSISNLGELINCDPDLTYWSSENSVHHYVNRLVSDGKPLNPSDPAQYAAAADYWKNEKIEIADTVSYWYGISSAMSLLKYKNLVVGNQNMLASGGKAYNNTVSDFYKCLYKLFKTSLGQNSLGPNFADWKTFQKEAKTSLSKYSNEQLLSFFLTYRWQTVCDVQSGFSDFVNDGAKIDKVANTLSGTKHACQRISFCEAEANDELLGYAIQTNGANLRVVNLEPDSQDFDCDAAAPLIFGKGQFRCVKFATGSSGQQQATGGAYFSVENVGETDPTIADKVASDSATQLMYTLIHESAHSIDYVKGIGTGSMGFSTQTSWTSISGWKKSGANWIFDKPFKYPSKLTASDPEPPCTIYGHAFPWEDFAEAWTYFVLNPNSLKKWYPKKHAFMQNNVVPFLNTVRR